jgi:sortase A
MTAVVAPERSSRLAVTGVLRRIGRADEEAGVTRPARTVRPVWATVLRSSLLSARVLAAWIFLYAFVLSGLQEGREQHVLYNQLRENLAGATTPIGGSITPGTPIAVLDNARLGLHDVVVEGTAANNLEHGPGHRRDTALPGQAGVSTIYGRAVTFGAPFRHITQLRAGDEIKVTTGQGNFSYRVDGVRHDGDPFPAPLAAGGGRLTLVTVDGIGWRQGWAPTQTVYVDATLEGKPQPTPAGRPSAIPASEKALHGDRSVLLELVLTLELLVAIAVGVTWAQSRWGRWQSWLVGAPALIAALWLVSGMTFQLLPNLM